MSRPLWIPLHVLCWNTHMGRTVTPDTWRWIRKMLPRIHVIFLQEVDDPTQLRRILGPDWVVIPQHRIRKSGTMLAFRRQRFLEVLGTNHKDVTHGSRHDRSLISLTAVDTRTKRTTHLSSIHTDPLGNGFEDADWRARRRHIRQTREWVRWARERQRPGDVTVIGGDTNEQLGEHIKSRFLRRRTANYLFSRVGLIAAFREKNQRDKVRLDDVFATTARYCRVVKRLQVQPPNSVNPHFDHDFVYVELMIRKAGT